jgi:hypothetical protein
MSPPLSSIKARRPVGHRDHRKRNNRRGRHRNRQLNFLRHGPSRITSENSLSGRRIQHDRSNDRAAPGVISKYSGLSGKKMYEQILASLEGCTTSLFSVNECRPTGCSVRYGTRLELVNAIGDQQRAPSEKRQ